ncbi:MAG: putative toxin-antitoxin system toxin component, PIN family [Betaproteobacteria bacterium]|nr:putative toxin-antitoxin system toxin component, PIN family [Betaproteobacteria bacterium]
MRLVLDTNTVVSGLLWHQAPAQLIHAALQGRIELFTSQALLLELSDVLPRAKFMRRIAASSFTVPQLIARYAVLARSVTPTSIASTSRDPDDDHVLACALAAQADLIVSGDADLLGLSSPPPGR